MQKCKAFEAKLQNLSEYQSRHRKDEATKFTSKTPNCYDNSIDSDD